jgi:hypothetical protein
MLCCVAAVFMRTSSATRGAMRQNAPNLQTYVRVQTYVHTYVSYVVSDVCDLFVV